MRRVLITGANSYVGTHVASWLLKEPDLFQVDTVETVNDAWKQADFTQYDVVYHVAAIVHQKEKKGIQSLYRQINTDLPVAVAKQAKASGVRQFIFMSSLSVYGLRVGIIDKKTIPAPTTMYGKSKLAAEKQLQALSSPDFHILILRPPLIYGEGCKGNYQKLVSFAKKALFFPDFPNSRSMLSIDNLCVLLRAAIVTEAEGVSLLQDPSFICTSEMVRAIAQQNHHKLYMVKWMNGIIKYFLKHHAVVIEKVFGDLIIKV